MTEPRLLIANRGEIAVRIMRSWHGESVAVAPADDATSLHARRADRLVELPGNGVAAYLDSGAVLAAAADTGTTHLHPGYGFLAEDATFAAACADADITFVGPSAEAMQRLGDKVAARALALEIGVPVAEGTDGAVAAEEALAFATTLGRPVMVKAAGGGGGRGMAEVHDLAELTDAVERCASEAERGFGDARVFVEELLHPARHVEVQVLGDGTSAVVLGDRDCSLQRRRQKIVELAPADVTHTVRDELHRHSIALAEAVGYRSLCTFEFLVGTDDRVVFIEANTRVQVEHTITEELTGLDLVALQFAVADGATLEDLGLTDTVAPRPRHRSVQVRVNAERLDADGAVLPASGTVERFTTPSGPGIRVETSVATGDRVSGRYDPMIAKLVVTAPEEQIDRRLGQALAETTVDGVDTNLDFVTHLLDRFGVADTSFHTTFVEAHASELLATMPERDRSTTPAGARLVGGAGCRPRSANVVGRSTLPTRRSRSRRNC